MAVLKDVIDTNLLGSMFGARAALKVWHLQALEHQHSTVVSPCVPASQVSGAKYVSPMIASATAWSMSTAAVPSRTCGALRIA